MISMFCYFCHFQKSFVAVVAEFLARCFDQICPDLNQKTFLAFVFVLLFIVSWHSSLFNADAFNSVAYFVEL